MEAWSGILPLCAALQAVDRSIFQLLARLATLPANLSRNRIFNPPLSSRILPTPQRKI
jgi:hypothetical protein